MTAPELKFAPIINGYDNEHHKLVFKKDVLPIFRNEGLQDNDAILDEKKDWKVDHLRYQGYAGYAHGYVFGCFVKGKAPNMDTYKKLLNIDRRFMVPDLDQLFGCCQPCYS